MGRNKMIAKSCPKCEMQVGRSSVATLENQIGCLIYPNYNSTHILQTERYLAAVAYTMVAVASKSCKCGHTFFASRRAADSLPAVEDIRRRTGRVRRSQPQFYDSQHYQKQKRQSPKKRSLSRSMEDDYKTKEKNETATARARRRRALRRSQREPPAGERTRDPTPQLRPSQLARCSLILLEINRKMQAVTWQPPADG